MENEIPKFMVEIDNSDHKFSKVFITRISVAGHLSTGITVVRMVYVLSSLCVVRCKTRG